MSVKVKLLEGCFTTQVVLRDSSEDQRGSESFFGSWMSGSNKKTYLVSGILEIKLLRERDGKN